MSRISSEACAQCRINPSVLHRSFFIHKASSEMGFACVYDFLCGDFPINTAQNRFAVLGSMRNAALGPLQ